MMKSEIIMDMVYNVQNPIENHKGKPCNCIILFTQTFCRFKASTTEHEQREHYFKILYSNR